MNRTRATGWVLVLGHLVAVAALSCGHIPLGVAIVLLTHGLFLLGTLVPNSQFFGPVVRRFATDSKDVWLTIDDGVSLDTTPALLDCLREHGVSATFFLVGCKSEKHPELVKRINDEGHQVANHTQTHPHASFWAAMPWTLGREIGESDSLFRSPVGMSNWFVHSYLRKRKARPIGWSVRGLDGINTTKSAVLQSLTEGMHPGAIVLLHDAYDPATRGYAPADILRELLQMLAEEGYRCVIPAASALRC